MVLVVRNMTILFVTGLTCAPRGGDGLSSRQSPLVQSSSPASAPLGRRCRVAKQPRSAGWRRPRTMSLPHEHELHKQDALPLSQGVLASVAETTKPTGYEGEFANRRRNTDEEGLQEFNMNVGRVIDTLRRDYPRMFFEPLDFDIYSPDLELRDPTGVVLNGLRPYQRLFATLRFFRQLMIYDVSTSIRISYDASRQQVRVSWSFVLHMRAATRPLHVDGISIYSLNVRGKVRKHVVEIIIVNGEPAKPPFAKAWINLPSWLAEGLKGGVTVPGLSTSRGFGVGTKDLFSSTSGWNAQYDPVQPASQMHQWTGTPRRFELPDDRTAMEGIDEGRWGNDLTRNELSDERDGAPDESWGPGAKGKVASASNEQRQQKSGKKKGFWPITDTPWGCETSWDCEAGKICCDLLLVKVCCTNGVMMPREGELIPLLKPIPGRRRDELDV